MCFLWRHDRSFCLVRSSLRNHFHPNRLCRITSPRTPVYISSWCEPFHRREANPMTTVHREVTMPAANEVLLITSGDLRLSANQVCWPAQRDMEEKLTAAFAQKGYKLVRAHPYDEKLKHGFISSQRKGMDVFMKIHPRGQARLRHRGVAVQPSCSARPAQPPGADPHRRQLVGPVAGTGGPAQSEWLARQGRQAVFLHLEQGLHRRVFPQGRSTSGCATAKSPTISRTSTRSTRQAARRERAAGRRSSPPTSSIARPSWASSTKAAWACTTPSSTTSC